MSKKFTLFCEESKKGANEIYNYVKIDVMSLFKHAFAFVLFGAPLCVWGYLFITNIITDVVVVFTLLGIAVIINLCWAKCIFIPFMKCFLPDIVDKFEG